MLICYLSLHYLAKSIKEYWLPRESWDNHAYGGQRKIKTATKPVMLAKMPRNTQKRLTIQEQTRTLNVVQEEGELMEPLRFLLCYSTLKGFYL